jgi:hypothetical protein
MQHPTRGKLLIEFGKVFLRRPVGQLWFLFGVKVVQIAKKFIEGM